jgi:hypothetical protein
MIELWELDIFNYDAHRYYRGYIRDTQILINEYLKDRPTLGVV